MQRYQSVPILWYLFTLSIAFTSGTVLCVRGNTTLKFTSYLVGVILGGFLSPVVGVLKARTGGTCYIGPIAKMVFGAILQPGHPLATAYFSATCTAVMSQCLVLASHFKMGAYLRVPPRVVFTAILFGIAISAAIELPIMFAIVSRQRETLLSDTGTLMWSGIQFQLVNQEAFSWSLTRKTYGPDGYFFVPMGFLIGIGLSAAWFLLTKVVPRIGSFDLTKDFHMSILIFETGYPISHHTNGLFTRVLVGAFSCLYLKLRHARFYHRQLPVIGAALDGGVAFMVLLVSLAFGGMLSRNAVKFPTWPGNPSKKSGVFPDHCPITGSAGGPE
ncbi:hypothetical protein FA10DRAFT_285125 [Acaromyces ingoldii]|uniref:OPT superfamily oligopeptide transporter n=1 Tax=Acaromyces ingoldii TaxID=215250 RepID=A0A316YRQ5_9BASI|nr:hypothetical protein FA10DRAFT_285125 [Acaromyces ingoldii]PWN92240.1 hypothetical protein FA10DRAFT_285125 [Acaromyces ingoldii]